MPNILKYNGELYAKIVDSDNEGVKIVENPTIENPAQEHGVSENASEVLQKIENLQHELTAEFEKLKSIQIHKESILLSDSLDLKNDLSLLKKAGEKIISYIVSEYDNFVQPRFLVDINNNVFSIVIYHSINFGKKLKEKGLTTISGVDFEKEYITIKTNGEHIIKQLFPKSKIHFKFKTPSDMHKKETITFFGELR